MTPSELNLRALSAREVIHRCLKAGQELWAGQQVHWQLNSNVGNFSLQAPMADSLAANAQAAGVVALAEGNEFVLCSFLQLTYTYPGNTNRKETFRYQSTDGFAATVVVQLEPAPDPGRMAAIIEVLKKDFTFLPIQELTKTMMRPPEVAALQLRESAVLDLHAQLSKLGGLLTTITERDVELRSRRMAELEAEHQARTKALENERAERLERDEVERKTKLDAIAAKEADLERRIEEHDARESKLVRRDLQKDLNKLLDEFNEFKLSDKTAEKRSPVKTGIVLLSLAFLGFAAVSGYDYFTTLDLHYLPALSAGVLGFAGTLLFFVKWSDQWFREHADEEMQSKRYKADMLRASWIAELAAEWAKEGKDAPPELLAVFAKNLFTTNTPVPEVEHPADALLNLLKRAQRLDVSKDRVTLEAAQPSPPK